MKETPAAPYVRPQAMRRTLLILASSVPVLSAEVPVDFNRDIRPLLNKNCTTCHGGVKQAGEVSFIFREEALGKGESGKQVVIPGDPAGSEMIRRIKSKDPEEKTAEHLPIEHAYLHNGRAVASSCGATISFLPFCHCTVTAKWRICLPSRSTP